MITIPIGADFENMNTSLKTKHGIDKCELMLMFLSILHDSDPAKDYELLRKWISYKIGRTMNAGEQLKLSEGIYRFIVSDPKTEQRREATNYLFEAEFLDEPQQGENHERA